MALQLHAYGDGSGTRTSRYTVLAAYIADPATWMGFNSAWNTPIFERGLEELHSVDLFTRARADSTATKSSRNPHFGWSFERFKALIDELADVVERFRDRLLPLAYVVTNEDFMSFSPNERRFLSGGRFRNPSGKWVLSGKASEPYMVAMHALLNQVVKALGPEVNITFMFDPSDSDGFAKALLNTAVDRRIWGDLQTRPTIGAGDSKKYPGIQLADLTAFLSNRWMQFGERRIPFEDKYAWAAMHDRDFTYDTIDKSVMERTIDLNVPDTNLRGWLRSR